MRAMKAHYCCYCC